MSAIAISVEVCLAAAGLLVWLLRRDQMSLGLPFAYLGLLLLNHLPGALVQLLSRDFFYNTAEVEIGIRLTAIGCFCFVVGVWIAQAITPAAIPSPLVRRQKFWLFCLFGGWLFTFVLASLIRAPSIGAVVSEAGAVWILGVLLGLRYALRHSDLKSIFFWSAALMVFPIFGLVATGFLSYAAAAVILVGAGIVVAGRSAWRSMIAIAAAAVFGMALFVTYFESRTAIRNAVWGGTSLENRVDVISGVFGNFNIFDPTTDNAALAAIDLRLNQNYFLGLAAERLEAREVNYLDGSSVEDGLIGLVPRILWPDKPVTAGSPKIVADMTGLNLNPTTSYGVGNVMEFYINFGLAGVIGGFLLLGWLFGFLDRKAALAEANGDLGTLLICFLPCVALDQPLGSVVELSSGTAAALLAGFGWRWLWNWWNAPATEIQPDLVTHS